VVSSTNKTDLHDITEILLKVALSTIAPSQAITNNSHGILHVPLKTVRKYASGEK
jgi:hypothetical protein